jgi:hypothetical protein
MKRRIAFLIALVLSVVYMSLTSSDSTVMAQSQVRIVADTGMVRLGPNQVLRTIMKDGDNNVTLENYAVRRFQYTQGDCTGGICQFAVASQNVSGPLPLTAGEALSVDVGPDIQGNGVRAVVLSTSRDVRVNAMIIDSVTGSVVSLLRCDRATPIL